MLPCGKQTGIVGMNGVCRKRTAGRHQACRHFAFGKLAQEGAAAMFIFHQGHLVIVVDIRHAVVEIFPGRQIQGIDRTVAVHPLAHMNQPSLLARRFVERKVNIARIIGEEVVEPGPEGRCHILVLCQRKYRCQLRLHLGLQTETAIDGTFSAAVTQVLVHQVAASHQGKTGCEQEKHTDDGGETHKSTITVRGRIRNRCATRGRRTDRGTSAWCAGQEWS